MILAPGAVNASAVDRHDAEALAQRARSAADRAPRARLARAGVQKIVINLAWLVQRSAAIWRWRALWGVHRLQPRGACARNRRRHISRPAASHARAFCRGQWRYLYRVSVRHAANERRSRRAPRAGAESVATPARDFGLEHGRPLAAAARRFTFSGIALYRQAFFAGCSDGAFPLKPLLLRSMNESRAPRSCTRAYGRTSEPSSGCRR